MSVSSPLSAPELARYSRQLLLGEVGPAGQERLRAARVLVVGAGGLGSPCALYLAAAGVGTVGIADFDAVAGHNLQRQLLHRDADVGRPKSASAARRLRETNPHIVVREHPDGVTPGNAVGLFLEYDIVVDGTDNFGARYLNNDAAFFARRPLVFGSVYKFSGQVAVFDPARGAPCYRCLFPERPAEGSVPGCGEAGVLGALCGIVGSLQALEALKLAAGFGAALRGQLLTYDGLASRLEVLTLPPDPACPLCGKEPRIRAVALPPPGDSSAPPAPTGGGAAPWEIPVGTAAEWLRDRAAGLTLLDVREPFEWDICHLPGAQLVPLRTLPTALADLDPASDILVYCHHGGRSLQATKFLRAQGFAHATNLAGGIDAWAETVAPGMPRY